MPQLNVETWGKIFTDAPKELLVLLLAAWSAGISLYLSVGLLGLCGYFEWIRLPGELNIFSNPLVFSAAFIIFIIEFIADKIPVVDSVWDSVHTFIRPLGGFAMGYMAGSEHGPVVQVVYAMVAGTLTLDMHTAKAAGRLAINTSPEPFSNWLASFGEEGMVLGGLWAMLASPVVFLGLLAVFLVIAAFVLYKLGGFLERLLRRV